MRESSRNLPVDSPAWFKYTRLYSWTQNYIYSCNLNERDSIIPENTSHNDPQRVPRFEPSLLAQWFATQTATQKAQVRIRAISGVPYGQVT